MNASKLVVTLALLSLPLAARAQLYITSYPTEVDEYSTSGTAESVPFDSPFEAVRGLTLSGGDLYVVDQDSGLIQEVNATTGVVVNQDLVSGLSSPFGVTTYDGNLYVVNNGNGTIGEYNATTGAAVNTSLVTGLGGSAIGIVASSTGELYVSNIGSGSIQEFNALTGAAGFTISDSHGPIGVGLVGNDLYVSNNSTNTIGEYNATTGATINATLATLGNSSSALSSLATDSSGDIYTADFPNSTIYEINGTTGATITSVSAASPQFLAIADSTIPEPSTMALMGVGLLVFAGRVRRFCR